MSIPVLERTVNELPFSLGLPGGLSQSDRLEFGVNLQKDSCLAILLKANDDEVIDSRIPLSLSLTLERVICKSGKNNQWQHAELTKNFSINPGDFLLSIEIRVNEYRIEVNGQHYCSFTHKFPSNAAQSLQIATENGMARVNCLRFTKKIHWVFTKMGPEIAEFAFQAGHDAEKNGIYVGRGLKNNSLVVVGVNPAKSEAVVGMNGLQWPVEHFDVLHANSYFGWKKVGVDKVIPASAIEAGFDENGNTLYVGRVLYDRSLVPGRVCGANGVLHVAYEGYELKFSSNYEVLVALTPKEVQNNAKAALLNEQLRELDAHGYIANTQPFECLICISECGVGDGVTLRDCLHEFCRECLANHIQHSEEATVQCPYQDDVYNCEMALQDREIRALVTTDIYKKHLAKSLREAEGRMENTFHCLTTNCDGWCTYDENVVMFVCVVCEARNCIKCKIIHDGTCAEYHEKLKRDRELQQKAETERQTQEQMDAMLRSREVMACPKCGAIIQKTQGCDGMICAVCKVSICWATRGLRWGPRGVGDTSGGCRCKVNGMRCHPQCQNCH